MRPASACVSIVLGLMASTSLAAQVTLNVMSWNVESGGTNADTMAARIEAFDGFDIWGLSEVRPSHRITLQAGAGRGEGAFFDGIMSETGNDDRLLIIYDTRRFELLGSEQLDEMNDPDLDHRSPLVGRFRDRDTNVEFLFMVNHLARGDAQLRRQQAEQLDAWAASQTLPVIAVGDYNFDFEVTGGDTDHDLGFDEIIESGALEWVRPETLIRTQCSADEDEPSGCRFNSVLDFVFAAGAAKDWNGVSEIVVRSGDFPDNHFTSDHRPVSATFEVTPVAVATLKEQLLERIGRLEQELAALRALVDGMP